MLYGLVKIVACRSRVEHVRIQHRVAGPACQFDAVVCQRVAQELEVVPDLLRGRVLQPVLQRREQFPPVGTLHGLFGEVARRQRNISAFALARGNGQTGQAQFHRVLAGRFRAHARCGSGLQQREAFLKLLGVQYGLVLCRFRRGRRRLTEAAEKAVEFEGRAQRLKRVHVRRPECELLRRDVQRNVLAYGRQFKRKVDIAEAGPQGLSGLAGNVAGVFLDAVKAPVGLQPLGGGLRPHAAHPGDVVRGIAGQGEIVADPLGRDAELLLHPGAVHDLVVVPVDQPDMRSDELREVLVGRGDQRIQAFFLGLGGKGSDYVVGLHTADPQQRHAHCLDHVHHRLDLLAQVFGHHVAIGLVFRVNLVTESRSGRIHDERQQVRRFLAEQPLDHAHHAVKRAGGPAVGGGERRESVVGAKQVGGSVHQQKAVHGESGAGGPGARASPPSSPAVPSPSSALFSGTVSSTGGGPSSGR